MKTKFADFIGEIEAEAKAEGSSAVKEIEVLREYYRVDLKPDKAHTCKHGNDCELCQEVCVCGHTCEWHGKGDCGLCGECLKFRAKTKKE